MPPPAAVLPYSAARRPWRVFFSPSSLSLLPSSYSEATSRIRHNLNHFRYNYALITLIILFLSLVYHPISLIVFLLACLAWLKLYFFRDDPVVFFGKLVSDQAVLVILSLVTVVALVLTNVGLNVLVGLCVAFVLIGIHAAFRATEDLFLDEAEAEEAGLISVVR